MSEGYWMIRKYKSGPIGESIKYWMPGRKPERMTRAIKREIQRAEKNSGSCIKQACRIVNHNFLEGDGFLSLDYSDAALDAITKKLPADLEETEREDAILAGAEHQAVLFLRRLKYAMEKDGKELRLFCTTSDRDWNEKKKELAPARVHHHMIVNAEAKPYIAAAWKKGGYDWKPISAQPDYTPVVTYMLKQVRHRADAKKYRTSRNLARVLPNDRAAAGASEIRPPRGAVLLERGEYQPGQPQYIRYILPTAYTEDDLELIDGVPRVAAVAGHRRIEKYIGGAKE